MELIVLWKLLAGIAFFLWGMQSIEDALKFLSSRQFKLFLKKLSAHRCLSILGGTLASMVMQSSSLST
jgi:phosphate:Na+ symporter